MQFKNNTKQRNTSIQGLRSFKDTLPKNLKKIINKKGHIYSETLSNWKYLVGNELFKVCFPKTFKNSNRFGVSTLVVMVKRGHEVDVEYSKKNILDKMNNFFGYDVVEKLKFISFDDEQKTNSSNETKSNNVAISKYRDKIIILGSFSNLNAEEIKRITVGNKDAKITIIAFESLTCSHCANFHKNVYPELKKEYLDTGLAKIEFRHFPLDIAAFNASKVAQCNNDGNSDILESLYANQQKWVKGSSVEEANKNLQIFLKNEGFSIDFESCVNNKNIEDFVLNDRIEGAKNFKISSTPTIIINNKKFEKKLNYKNLKKALEKMI